MTETETALATTPTTPERPRHTGSSAAKIMLQALAIALDKHRGVPTTLDSVDARRVLAEIHSQQAEAGWKQLRSRYHVIATAAREFQLATLRAAAWVDEIATTAAVEIQHGCPARLALIAALAKRLIIDGQQIAQRSAAACHRALGTNPTTAIPESRTPQENRC